MAEHWCQEHQTVWFKKGKMKGYAHPIKDESGEDTGEWCNEPKEDEGQASSPEPANEMTNEMWSEKQKIERDSIEAQVAFKGIIALGSIEKATDKMKIAQEAALDWAIARLQPNAKPSREATKSKSSTTKEETSSKESFIDMDWLKESLKTLQDKGIKAYSNANVLSYLNAIIGEKSESVSEAVSKLNQDQARGFDGKVQEALK